MALAERAGLTAAALEDFDFRSATEAVWQVITGLKGNLEPRP
jgi:hypothetical protein